MGAVPFVPDMGRRNLMNGLLLGSVAGPLLVLPGPMNKNFEVLKK